MDSIIRTFSLHSYIPFRGSLASSCIDQNVYIIFLVLLFASLQEDDNAPDREEVFYRWLGCILYSACLCLLSTIYWNIVCQYLVAVWTYGIEFCSANQDIKPRFHQSRIHGADGGEDNEVLFWECQLSMFTLSCNPGVYSHLLDF